METRRFTNTFKLDEYINAVIFNKSPEISSDVIDVNDAKFEFIMLGLRTVDGISIQVFNSTFDCDFIDEYKDVLSKKQEFLELADNTLKIKEEYLYVQNDIILSFMK